MASIQRIAIKDIALNDDRRVGGKGALHTLVHSIEKVGLINPITVRKSGDAAFPYSIIAGRRRVEAAILLDWTEIDALVYEADEAADDSYFTHLALAENVNRLDLHPLDEGAQYARLLKEEGYTVYDLTGYFDRSMSHIYQRMKLVDLIQEVQELFRKERIKISAAAKIASLPKKVQKEIYQNLIKNQIAGGDTDKTIDRVIGQMMRMPLDFPCVDCSICKTKRTHYGSAALFPEYSEQNDYCMDSRCYEKNIRSFYQNAVSEFLEDWGEAKAVYIYEESSVKAEYLRSILDKKPLIETVPVHVYHESFEDCSAIRVLDDDEKTAVYSFSRDILKDYTFLPVLYFQDKRQDPIFYIAVDDASYEEIFPSDSNEAEKAAGSDEAVESNGCDTGGDTDSRYTDGDNQKENASGAEQVAEEAVDARDWQTSTPRERMEVLKRTLLTYLRLEERSTHHPFFYSPGFRRILEEQPYFEEAFQLVAGLSSANFYQRRRYEDISYQRLLEIYVYADIIEQGQAHFHRLKVVNGVPFLQGMELNSDRWQKLYKNEQALFLRERANGTPEKTAQEEAEKKTAATAGT